MDAETMRRRVTTARVGRLATVGADGSAHVVPVCFAVVGDTVFSAVDHKPKRSTRLRRLDNLRATGAASLLVDHYDEDWSTLWWVRLDGSGRVSDDAAVGLTALTEKYEQYARQPPAGPFVVLEVTRWSGWSGGPR